MPDDDLGNRDLVLDSSSSGPEARQRKKSRDFANDFIRALDVLVLSELAALYYADCLTTTLILRSLIQVFLSPPVNLGLQTPVPNPRSHLSLILFATFLSLLLHLFAARPAADERGYLHGGILVDFVGSPAKISIWQLIFMDLFIGFLQLLTLAATIERHEMGENTPITTSQDHNAEERGVRRSMENQSGGAEGAEDIELQNLLTEPGPDLPPTAIHPLDQFYSGEMVILELNILKIKRQLTLERGNRIDPARLQAVFGTLLSRRLHAPTA